jgi:hypothetical protein
MCDAYCLYHSSDRGLLFTKTETGQVGEFIKKLGHNFLLFRNTSLRNQQNYETEYLTHRNGDDIRPLNTSTNPNNTFSTSASTVTPQPAPRNQPPSLTARPNSTLFGTNINLITLESVLRSPHLYQLPPNAHLGGGANSLNSSFSSTVPGVPPSVSADV